MHVGLVKTVKQCGGVSQSAAFRHDGVMNNAKALGVMETRQQRKHIGLMEPTQYMAMQGLLDPQRTTGSSVKASTEFDAENALKLFPRLPKQLSDDVQIRTRHGIRMWRSATASLRGNALVVTGDGVDVAFDVLEANEFLVRGRRVLEVNGSDGVSAALEFSNDRRPAWLEHLRSVADSPQLSDFEIVRAIGKGGGGSIFLVKSKRAGSAKRRAFGNQYMAMKVIQKYHAFHSNTTLQHTLDERLALELAGDFPFIVKLKHAFQTDKALYLITEFCEGGDLRALLNRQPNFRLGELDTKRIFAQILLAVEHLHSLNIMHRDIKAENVLFDSEGNVKLCDLGLSKVMKTGRFGRTKSFCGTTGYMSPDIIRRGSYGIATDLWSLGILLYRCLVGRMPFADTSKKSPFAHSADDIETRRRILQDDIVIPSESSGLVSSEATELLTGLLNKDETKRLNLEEVKESLFFKDVDFDSLLGQSTMGSMESVSNLESSDDEGIVQLRLGNFELDKLHEAEAIADDLRGQQARTSREVSQAATGRARSARKLVKRVASGGMRRRPSATSVIGFAYSSQ